MHRRFAGQRKGVRRMHRAVRAVFPIDDAGRLDTQALIADAGHYMRLHAAFVVGACMVAEFLLRLSTTEQFVASLPLVPSALLVGMSFSVIQSREGLSAALRALFGGGR
jgi:hypothetical protein